MVSNSARGPAIPGFPAGPTATSGSRNVDGAATVSHVPAAPTPAVAALNRAKVPYLLRPYEHDPRTTAFGDEVVQALGQDPGRVFKTLIAAVDGRLVVGIVPVAGQLDLKALAAAAGGKRATMAPVAEAERSSGYVAGGISPLGQRKRLTTVLDSTAEQFPTIFVSAGRRGLQLELAPADLTRVCDALVAHISSS
jgi:Cys-tRNA(Pro)/Cys-tRNA(Cys) deacylase